MRRSIFRDSEEVNKLVITARPSAADFEGTVSFGASGYVRAFRDRRQLSQSLPLEFADHCDIEIAPACTDDLFLSQVPLAKVALP